MQAIVSNPFQLKQSKGDRHVTYVAWKEGEKKTHLPWKNFTSKCMKNLNTYVVIGMGHECVCAYEHNLSIHCMQHSLMFQTSNSSSTLLEQQNKPL
jgi:hypothetical protein